jgi:hypothetical protein
VFGRLKGRFKRFRTPSNYGGTKFMADMFITAACIHNFIESTNYDCNDDMYSSYMNEVNSDIAVYSKFTDIDDDPIFGKATTSEDSVLFDDLNDGGLEEGKRMRQILFTHIQSDL